jgi:hypothetical protein
VQAGQAKDSKLRPSSLLFLEMRLHIHARLRASENNQIGHRCRMTARRISSLI